MTGRILITGSSGFLGREVVSLLSSRGHPLTLLTRRHNHQPEVLAPEMDSQIVTSTDLASGVPAEALSGVTHVVHLAGLAHVGN